MLPLQVSGQSTSGPEADDFDVWNLNGIQHRFPGEGEDLTRFWQDEYGQKSATKVRMVKE